MTFFAAHVTPTHVQIFQKKYRCHLKNWQINKVKKISLRKVFQRQILQALFILLSFSKWIITKPCVNQISICSIFRTRKTVAVLELRPKLYSMASNIGGVSIPHASSSLYCAHTVLNNIDKMKLFLEKNRMGYFQNKKYCTLLPFCHKNIQVKNKVRALCTVSIHYSIWNVIRNY